MCHTIGKHKLNDKFTSSCDHRMNWPCDAVPVLMVITHVLIYELAIAFLLLN